MKTIVLWEIKVSEAIHNNEQYRNFKSYKLRIHIHVTKLVMYDNITITVEIGKNKEIKSQTETSKLQTQLQEVNSIGNS